MTAPAVHQFVPMLTERDATGAHTLLLQAALRRAGWQSEIFTQVTHPDTADRTIQMEEFPSRASGSDVLIYQFAVASPIADFLLGRPEAVVLDYHNVTPPRFFQGWDQGTVSQLVVAREELSRLCPRVALGLADSAYNERDLTAAGCRRTAILPVLVDLARCAGSPDPAVGAALERTAGDGIPDWLFIGRLVPSKAQHRLVMALWAHHQLFGPARLHLIGSSGCDGYADALTTLIDELGMAPWVDLVGGAPDTVMAAHLRHADVYVSLSQHEGFGVPLLEAMAAGLPVVALGAAAVPETVEDAALVLPRNDPAYVATAVHRATADPTVRAHLVERGAARAGRCDLQTNLARAVDTIATVAGPPRRAGAEAAP